MPVRIAIWPRDRWKAKEKAREVVETSPAAPATLWADAQGRWPESGVADGYLYHPGVLPDGEFLGCESDAEHRGCSVDQFDRETGSRGKPDRTGGRPVDPGSGPGSGAPG